MMELIILTTVMTILGISTYIKSRLYKIIKGQ